ncbi:MAG TPA: CBS domain-containing protein [Planctomycetaceae bacterium]|nr:CBS domain-containing protein [Planctomycetaceae bacterium]|tara:strand:- start:129 stop:548 length:420 start_codon:yes stop_codon:yes gene_type:complete
MKKNESVTKIMTSNPVCVSVNGPVSDARKMLEKEGVHHLPIVEGDQLVGILTSNDFLRVSFGEFGNQDSRNLDAILDHTYKLSELMNANPVTVDAQKTVRDAATILAGSNFHALPVVDDSKLIGIVTSSDLINYLLEQY